MAKDVFNPTTGNDQVLEVALAEELSSARARLGKSLLDVQRDLRIKAAFIAAIESGNVSVFQNRGVIPGYVRSYARYLNLDPEAVYRKFRAETGFSASGPTFGGDQAQRAVPRGTTFDKPRGISLPAIPFSAIGSLLIMTGLVAGLGYGGWTVLRNIQRVQFAPVEEIPLAVSDVGTIAPPATPGPVEPALSDLARPVAATALAELYRDQEAEVAVLMPRDGPIASINPDLVRREEEPMPVSASLDDTAAFVAAAVAASVASVEGPPMPDKHPDPASKLTVVAERSAWIRVYLDNGTVIFESILEKGATYSPPDGVGTPLIWAGNSGSVYVKVGDALHGPLGSGTRAAKGILLDPTSIAEKFALVEQVPEVISQTIGADSAQPPVPDVAIQ